MENESLPPNDRTRLTMSHVFVLNNRQKKKAWSPLALKTAGDPERDSPLEHPENGTTALPGLGNRKLKAHARAAGGHFVVFLKIKKKDKDEKKSVKWVTKSLWEFLFSCTKSTQGRVEDPAMWATLVETQVDSQIESKLLSASAQGHCCNPGPRAFRTKHTNPYREEIRDSRVPDLCLNYCGKQTHAHTQRQRHNCYWPEYKSQAQQRVWSSRMNLEGWTEASFGEFWGSENVPGSPKTMCLQDNEPLTGQESSDAHKNNKKKTTHAHKNTSGTTGSISLLTCLKAACSASSLSSYRIE